MVAARACSAATVLSLVGAAEALGASRFRFAAAAAMKRAQRRRSQQQCSLWVGAEGGDASRFRFATPAAMIERCFAVFG